MILRSDAIEFCKDSTGDQSLPVSRILSAYHQWLESTGHQIVSVNEVRHWNQKPTQLGDWDIPVHASEAVPKGAAYVVATCPRPDVCDEPHIRGTNVHDAVKITGIE